MRAGSRFNCIILVLALLYGVGFVTAEPSWWQPVPGTTWQWQLAGVPNIAHDVQMYDLDLFETPAEMIAALHGAGRIVVCYFSAGSYEKFRPDKDAFPASVKGKKLDGWPGERWLDVRQLAILAPIMEARLDLAVTKGCDAVEPDNIDGYTNKTGFPLTYADQLAYNLWLAAEAHERGLSIGLKNDLAQIPDLVASFDWALNEQCYQYQECDLLLPFVTAGKAVFGVEYMEEGGNPLTYCPQAVAAGFSWLVKTYDLGDSPVNPCSDYLPVPVSFPANDGSSTRPLTVRWLPHAVGTQYRVILTRSANGKRSDSGWLPASGVCDPAECQYTPSGTLKTGTYTLKIKTKWSGAVRKPSSAKIRFTVAA